jgi:hypothetical protein
MSPFQVVLGVVAWGTLGVFGIGAVVGIPLLERRYRSGLTVLFIATLGGFVFSFIAGFSLGRFTALLPLLLTAFAITFGRAALLLPAAQAAAIGIYVLLAWLIPEHVGYWGIHIELPLCIVAYGIAFLAPPRARLTSPTG